MTNDVFTLDENNNAAIRTLGVNPGTAETNSPSVFTEDENGNACIRVMGGAGSLDESKIIVLSDTIPTADADTLGKFYCYKGTTDANYTHGYVYECVEGSPTYTGTVSFEAATLSGTTVTCSGDNFANFLTEAGDDPVTIVSGTMTYDAGADGWRLVGKDAEDTTVTSFIEYTQDYEDHGFVFTGTPVDGDVIAFTCTVESNSTYSWERVDLQPAAKLGRYLAGWNCATGLAMTNPPESPYVYTTGDYFIVGVVATGGASNYKPNGSSYTTGTASTTVETETVNVNDTYLYDGTNWTLLKTGNEKPLVNMSSSVNSCVVNKRGAGEPSGNSVTVFNSSFGTNNTNNGFVSIGGNHTFGSTQPGNTSIQILGSATGTRATAFGSGALASGTDSVAINTVNGSAAGEGAIAIGKNCGASASGSVQIGCGATLQTNADANTFKFANANGNFELVSANGTVPADRTNPVVDVATATLTQELAIQHTYNCGEMTSLDISFPATMTNNYIAEIDFTSGATPTSLTAPNTIKWKGDDLTGGVFVPVASKRYCVLFYYDGVNVRAIVQGIA